MDLARGHLLSFRDVLEKSFHGGRFCTGMREILRLLCSFVLDMIVVNCCPGRTNVTIASVAGVAYLDVQELLQPKEQTRHFSRSSTVRYQFSKSVLAPCQSVKIY